MKWVPWVASARRRCWAINEWRCIAWFTAIMTLPWGRDFFEDPFFVGGMKNKQLRDLSWKSEGLTPLQCHVSPQEISGLMNERTIHHQWSLNKALFIGGGLALQGTLRFAGIYGNCEGISPCHTDALFGCHMMIWGLPVKIYRGEFTKLRSLGVCFWGRREMMKSLPKHKAIR